MLEKMSKLLTLSSFYRDTVQRVVLDRTADSFLIACMSNGPCDLEWQYDIRGDERKVCPSVSTVAYWLTY